jgi:hypothetical protein
MLNSGKKIRALQDKNNKYSNSRVVRRNISERNKKNIPSPPLQVKWSVPYDGNSISSQWTSVVRDGTLKIW